MRTLTTLAVALAILSAHYWPAAAQGYDNPTREFFKSLKQPVTGFSCCDAADCRPTHAAFMDGAWWAVPEYGKDGEVVKIPDQLVIRDKVSPFQEDGEGLAILCQSEYQHAYTVTVTGTKGTPVNIFCFLVPPTFS